MLFAVRIGEPYRPTRDLDLLGTGEPTEAAIEAAVRDIVTTPTVDDGVSLDLGTLQVQPIREDNRYGGIRATMQAPRRGAYSRPDRHRLRRCDHASGSRPGLPDAAGQHAVAERPGVSNRNDRRGEGRGHG